jgi:hypothetical protein
MKKKILSLALAVWMLISLFTLTSCAKETPFTLVKNAVEKTNALDAIDVDMTMDMSVDMMGISMTIPMTVDMQATGLKTEAPKVYTNMKTETAGVEMTVEIYQDAEYFYITIPMLGNIKTKAASLTADYDSISDVESMIKVLPEEFFTEEIAIVENEDGTKTVSIDIADEKFNELYKDFVDGATASIAEGTELKEFALANAKVEVTVNEDGYVAVYKIAFDMEMTLSMGEEMAALGMDEMEVSATVDSVITYNNPGAVVTVTPMENLDSFEEITEEDLAALGI